MSSQTERVAGVPVSAEQGDAVVNDPFGIEAFLDKYGKRSTFSRFAVIPVGSISREFFLESGLNRSFSKIIILSITQENRTNHGIIFSDNLGRGYELIIPSDGEIQVFELGVDEPRRIRVDQSGSHLDTPEKKEGLVRSVINRAETFLEQSARYPQAAAKKKIQF